MDTIDYSQPTLQILIDMINRKNGTNLQVRDFDINEPTPFIVSSLKTDTVVTLTPLAGSGFYGTRSIHYNRLNVDDIFGRQAFPYQPTTEATLLEYLPTINEFYGIHLKPEDIYDSVISAYNPLHPTAVRTVTLAVKPNSYFFTGSYDFVFGISNNAVQEVDGVTRTYFIALDGLPINQVKNSFIAMNVDGSTNTGFTFLANVDEISSWTLDRVTRLANGHFVFDGDFILRYNQAPLLAACASVEVDVNGVLVNTSTTKRFNIDNALQFTESPAIAYKYVIDPSRMTTDHHLYRYTDAGLLDATYSPEIDYEPKFIRLTPDHKLYTVSDVFESGDPANNNILTKMIRVDRLLSNGLRDLTFDTIFIRSSDPLVDPMPIMDICPIDTGGIYLAFVPLRTTDINSPSPIINGQTLLNIDITAGATYSWNPVVRFEADGALDTTFKTMLPGLRSTAIYEPTGSPLTWGSKALISEGEKTFFMTYRRNPITGYEHRQPFQYGIAGQEVLLNGLGYKDQYKWNNLIDIFSQSNGLFLGYGTMQTYQQTGTLSVPYSAVARYKQSGEIDRLIWRSPGPTGSSSPVVKAVFLKEVV